MTTAIFLLTLSFAYILLGTCAQFTSAVLISNPLLKLHWQHLPFLIIVQAVFVCLFFVSGFRRDAFVFLYPFLLTLLLHLCSNLWYITHVVHFLRYQSGEVQQFFEYCSRDILSVHLPTKQCICVHDRVNDQYVADMSCVKVKLLIELVQLMPFISILLVLADFYTFMLVAFVYVYEKRSLVDYLPAPEEYDVA